MYTQDLHIIEGSEVGTIGKEVMLGVIYMGFQRFYVRESAGNIHFTVGV